MKRILWAWLLAFVFLAPVLSASGTEPAPLRCRVVTLNCDCTNPPRKFVVEDQKVGRVNPGDPGVCESSVYIDDWLSRNPYTACVRGGQQGFDPQKPPACKATWTCKETCTSSD